MPANLDSLPPIDKFPRYRNRWNTNEEIAGILVNKSRHKDWMSNDVPLRPNSGSLLLYNKKKVRYKRDGYCWKSRRGSRQIREDHMKLKVNGVECINGVYSHSALLPSFHRRCYFLIQNPDTVLVHYLNVPYAEDASFLARPTLPALGPPSELASTSTTVSDGTEEDSSQLWTQQQLLDQLQPMFAPTPCEDSSFGPGQVAGQTNSTSEQKVSYSVSSMVCQLIQLQKLRQHFRINSSQKPLASPVRNKGVYTMSLVTNASTVVNSLPTPTDAGSVTVHSSADLATPVSAGQSGGHMTECQSGHIGVENCEGSAAPGQANISGASISMLPSHTIPSSASSGTSSVPVSVTGTSALSHVFVNVYRVSGDGAGGQLLAVRAGSAGTGALSPAEPPTVTSILVGRCSDPAPSVSSAEHPVQDSSRHGGVLETSSTSLSGRSGEFCPQRAVGADSVGGVGDRRTEDAVSNQDVDMSESATADAMLRDALDVSLNDVRCFDGDSSLKTTQLVETTSTSRFLSSDNQQFPSLSSLPAVQLDASNCGRSHCAPGENGRSQKDTTGDVNHNADCDNGRSLSADCGSGRSLIADYGSGRSQTDTAACSESIWAEPIGNTNSMSTHGRSQCVYELDGMDESSASGRGRISQEVTVAGITEDVSLFDTLDDLDAFDFKCLGADSDCAPSESSCVVSEQPTVPDSDDLTMRRDSEPTEDLLTITEICPDWSYTEGGTKLLIIGGWTDGSAPYTAVFGHVSVECSVIQPGVLRCYCPPHGVDSVSVRVLRAGRPVSHSALFHYHSPPTHHLRGPSSCPPLMLTADCCDEVLVKMALVWRIRLLQKRLHCADEPQLYDQQLLVAIGSELFEERLIEICDGLAVCRWRDETAAHHSSQMLPTDSPSLLHLVSSLGMHRLVCALFRWRTESPSLCLEAEVDALRADGVCGGATPLLLACSRGHRETARLLHQWNPLALSINSTDGISPVTAARKSGFFQLAEELERLDTARQLARTVARQSDHNLSMCDQCPPVSTISAAPGSFLTDCPGQDPAALLDRRQLFGSCSPGCGSCDSGLESLRCTCCDQQSSGVNTNNSCLLQPQQHVLTLAEHIIAAMPDRIKMSCSCQLLERSSSCSSCDLASLHSEPVSMEIGSVADVLSSGELSHRCVGAATPLSSVDSPCSSVSYQPSPHSISQSRDASVSPPPSTADLGHYFQATRRDVTVDFSNLTLSDMEQRELYEAAKVIQKAYRLYKGRKMAEEKLREKEAANIIQNGFRRYKQYCYYTKMTRAAVVIQNRYRTYCEHKRFRHANSACSSGCTGLDGRISGCVGLDGRSSGCSGLDGRSSGCAGLDGRNSGCSGVKSGCAAVQGGCSGCCCLGREKSRSQICQLHAATAIGHKRTYSQRRQHLAATKIQHFMRQSRNRLKRARELVIANAVCPPQPPNPP